ncbi:HAD family phosphatase [Phenylobacterium hankyongense]|uniref:HAD family phosphatase n=1 Tax=Phenylobacterium hankyongense TaxID=1813876 RepID=A0A328AZN2_9CAUL|nr:HAD family phosphatase [Phenylobacterium hankyongense]RAK59064.1 HAD family phosphatase [Phenylobacterium hankyongense]
MARALLWDIGNVIVRWDPRTLYSQVFDDPAECDRFLSQVCTMDWHLRHDLGVTFAENRAPLLARFPEYSDQIHAWETRWWEMFSGAIPETEAAIEALAARGVPQFGLSNMSHEVIDGITAMSPAFRHFGGIVISAETAVMKPDPRIYRQACERFGVAPEDVLFVDDSARNIEGARALGFDVHHFTDPAALRPALEARGLL